MKNIKKKLIVMLSTCLVASTAGAVGMLSASATTGVDADRFAMGELASGGVASIRVVEPRGLRFVAEIGSNVYADLIKEEDGVEKKMGMYVVPYTYLSDETKFSDGATGVSEKNYENLTTKIDCVFYDSSDSSVVNKIYQDGDYYYANGVIGDLYLKNYDRAFVGIAYIAETSNDVTTYKFTEVDETVSRTATYVAEAAYQAAASSSASQAVIEEYVIGAHLYERELLTETVIIENGVRTVTYTYNSQNYSTLKEVKEVANVSFEIALDKETATIYTGESVQLTASVTESEEEIGITKKVLWRSSNEDVVTVDANGKVSYVGVGTATITASFLGETAECEVTSIYGDKASALLATKVQNIDGNKPNTFYSLDFATSIVDSQTFGGAVPNGTSGWLTKYDTTVHEGKNYGNLWGGIALIEQTDFLAFENKELLQNAYVGFWVYADIVNSGNPTLAVDAYIESWNNAKASSYIQTVSDGAWTYVEFDLSKLGTIINANGDVRPLHIAIRYSDKSNKDGFAETLYITGFDVYTESRTVASLIAGKMDQTKDSNKGTKFYSIKFNASVEVASNDVNCKWMTKYDLTTRSDVTAGNTFGGLMRLSQADMLSINNIATIKDGYVGFWIYATKNSTTHTSVDLRVYTSNFNTTDGSYKQTLVCGEWNYVEFKLSDLTGYITDNGDGTVTLSDLCLALRYAGSVTTDFSETAYVAGFDIYTESKK